MLYIEDHDLTLTLVLASIMCVEVSLGGLNVRLIVLLPPASTEDFMGLIVKSFE